MTNYCLCDGWFEFDRADINLHQLQECTVIKVRRGRSRFTTGPELIAMSPDTHQK